MIPDEVSLEDFSVIGALLIMRHDCGKIQTRRGGDTVTPKTIEEVVRKFASEAKSIYGPALGEVILFGSCARGDFAPDSDIDVMVLLDVPQEAISTERRKMMAASDRLDLDYDVLLSPVFQSRQTFERYLSASPFYQNVRKDGVRYA